VAKKDKQQVSCLASTHPLIRAESKDIDGQERVCLAEREAEQRAKDCIENQSTMERSRTKLKQSKQ
jgi:hypothetical protein